MFIFIDFQKITSFSENTKALATVTQNHQNFVKQMNFGAIYQVQTSVFRFLKNNVLLATLTQKLKNIRDFSKFYFFQIF